MQQREYTEYVNKYCQAALSIIDNLSRQLQAEMFEDEDYVKDYIQKTIEETQADLDVYKPIMTSRYGANSSCVQIIDTTLAKLDELRLSDEEELSSELISMM